MLEHTPTVSEARKPPLDEGILADVPQTTAMLREHRGKLPIFYRDASSVTVILPARADRVATWIPHRRLHADVLIPGVAAVAITVFEYRDTDIGPYNELAVSVPVGLDRRPLPFESVLRRARTGTMQVYVRHLPVTTEVALAGGVDLYGYPKTLAEIGFDSKDGHVTTSLVRDGRTILTLAGATPRLTAGRTKRCFRTYATRHGRLVEGTVLLEAPCIGEAIRPRDVGLELDRTHPIGAEIAEALLSRRPVVYEWTPRFRSILHAPVWLE